MITGAIAAASVVDPEDIEGIIDGTGILKQNIEGPFGPSDLSLKMARAQYFASDAYLGQT